MNAKPLKPMTGEQFDAALLKLFGEGRQSEFARLTKINLRTVGRWASGKYPVPTIAAMLLNLMIDTKTKPEKLRP